MKKVAVLFAMLFAVAQGRAQVTVEVQLDQEQYLPNEALIAKVRIHNSSGQTIRLGQDQNWLTFLIEPSEKQFVRQLKIPDVMGVFDLESSSVATKRVDLSTFFDLTKVGSYKVKATVTVPAFRDKFASAGKQFIINNGSKMRELTFGVPTTIAPPDKDGKPEVRKYILVQTNPGADSKLFVRVTDPNENNLKVVPVGPLVGLSRPEPQMDRWNNLHIIYQTAARTLLYTMINPEGMILAQETHEITDSRPTLTSNDEGRISVRGGGRRFTSHDIPPVDPVLAAAAAQAQLYQEPTLPRPTNSPAATKNGNDAKEKKKR